MTDREEQILRWIEENPMISQQELADKAGITRSSVGVHISNLMKKGVIVGKGYVLSQGPYVAVVGGINQDIGGKPFEELIGADSNPGTVDRSIGGVGHNIACNMSLLGLKVKMLTALGDDDFTGKVQESCNKLGIDLSNCTKISGASSATYLYVANRQGDMNIAIADMEIFNHVDISYMERVAQVLQRAEVVVVDTNIPEATIRWITENCERPVFVDPVSSPKAIKLKKCLKGIHTIKPNKLEAELLSGIEIVDDESLEKAALKLIESGIEQVFISLGKDGLYYANRYERGKVPCSWANVLNTTGAGDALMAGIVWGYINEKSIEETARVGVSAAAIATETPHTINRKMTINSVLERI